MNEKELKALEILNGLKTSSQEVRDAWKKKSLDAFPDDENMIEFINLAYEMASES